MRRPHYIKTRLCPSSSACHRLDVVNRQRHQTAHRQMLPLPSNTITTTNIESHIYCPPLPQLLSIASLCPLPPSNVVARRCHPPLLVSIAIFSSKLSIRIVHCRRSQTLPPPLNAPLPPPPLKAIFITRRHRHRHRHRRHRHRHCRHRRFQTHHRHPLTKKRGKSSTNTSVPMEAPS